MSETLPESLVKAAPGERRRCLLVELRNPNDSPHLEAWSYVILETGWGLYAIYLGYTAKADGWMAAADRAGNARAPAATHEMVGNLSSRRIPPDLAAALAGIEAPYCFDRLTEMTQESRLFCRTLAGGEIRPEVDDGR